MGKSSELMIPPSVELSESLHDRVFKIDSSAGLKGVVSRESLVRRSVGDK